MAGGRYGFKTYWKNVWPSTFTSLGTCSSAATIPTNFDNAEKMGVSKNVREAVIPIASALHKDGSVMGGVVKIAFAFGVFGMNFSGMNIYLVTIGIALLVGMVMGAIPNGGMIGEMLILSLFGLPIESLPILAAISALIDPPATMLNATGDLSVSMLIERMTKNEGWEILIPAFLLFPIDCFSHYTTINMKYLAGYKGTVLDAQN
jgi:Na+/H+-dicarboxylate symporter